MLEAGYTEARKEHEKVDVPLKNIYKLKFTEWMEEVLILSWNAICRMKNFSDYNTGILKITNLLLPSKTTWTK